MTAEPSAPDYEVLASQILADCNAARQAIAEGIEYVDPQQRPAEFHLDLVFERLGVVFNTDDPCDLGELARLLAASRAAANPTAS